MNTLSLRKTQKDTVTLTVIINANLAGADILFSLAHYNQGTEGIDIVVTPGETQSRIDIDIHYNLTGALKPNREYSFGVTVLWPGDKRDTYVKGKLWLEPKVADVVVSE